MLSIHQSLLFDNMLLFQMFLHKMLFPVINNNMLFQVLNHNNMVQLVPRPIRRDRKRPFLIVFDSFGSDRITAVFHRIINEHKRSDIPFSGRLYQLLTVYDTIKNGPTTITTKWGIYSP
jgi:hypothetical protein